jgi:hypothetical protein
MKSIINIRECNRDCSFERTSHKNRNVGKETYNIVQEYSEYSTIQGILYIFKSGQTTFGKIFWTVVVVLMLMLGTYWSIDAYISWDENQVVFSTF